MALEDFEADLKNNLYRIWNRMSSGSYLPGPVKGVEIPKHHGGGSVRSGCPRSRHRARSFKSSPVSDSIVVTHPFHPLVGERLPVHLREGPPGCGAGAGLRGRPGRAGDVAGRLDRSGPAALGHRLGDGGPGGVGRVGGRVGPSTTCAREAGMILYSNDRQDGCGSMTTRQLAGPPPAAGSVAARRGGADLGFGGRAGPALRQGGMSMLDGRPARSLHLCGAAPDGGPHPHGVRAGRGGRGGSRRGDRLAPGAPGVGGDLGHQRGAVVPGRAALSELGGRGGGGGGQHGGLGVGGRQ